MVIRHKKEEHTEHYQAHERNDIGGLLSELHGQRHSQCHTGHVAHFTYHQEQAGIQHEIEEAKIEECIGTDIVLEEIGGSSSTHRIEEIRQQCRTVQYPPGRVAHQRLHILADGFGRHTLDMLARHAKTNQKAQKAERGNAYHGILPTGSIAIVH